MCWRRRSRNTREGNADMGACVPPLHVASIGIEGVIIHGAQGARSLTVLLCPAGAKEEMSKCECNGNTDGQDSTQAS